MQFATAAHLAAAAESPPDRSLSRATLAHSNNNTVYKQATHQGLVISHGSRLCKYHEACCAAVTVSVTQVSCVGAPGFWHCPAGHSPSMLPNSMLLGVTVWSFLKGAFVYFHCTTRACLGVCFRRVACCNGRHASSCCCAKVHWSRSNSGRSHNSACCMQDCCRAARRRRDAGQQAEWETHPAVSMTS